jgi:hypothetical protein
VSSATSRRRIAGWCAALLIEALIIFALLTLGGRSVPPPVSDPSLLTFTIGPQAEPAKPSPRKESPKPREAQARSEPPQKPPPPAQPVPPPPVKPTTPPSPSKGFVELSREDLAAGDISKLGSKSGGNSASGDSAAIIGPGQGPGGKPLYNAEWVREPTDSELAPYFAEAKGRPAGAWAMVACRTIANNKVDNCQTMGESPRGSGLAKALRLASWQFLVRPPRVGNKPQLGVWVRIRFDFNKAAVEAE